VFARLDAMQSAYRGGAQAATSAGFDVLDRLGQATDLGQLKATATPALGSNFANDVLLCMSVTGYVNPVDFSLALGAGGVFTIRNGASTAKVLSRSSDTFGPLFGAEPMPVGAVWPLGGKTLFYGWPVSTATLAGEGVSGKVFDLRTLPSGLTFSAPIRAGVCVTDAEGARILHKHAGDPAVILPPAGRPAFCPAAPTSSLDPARSPFAFAAQTLASWFAPRPAYAARAMMPAFGGGGGGLVSGLSEIGPVEFTASVAFTDAIKNAARSDTTKGILDNNPNTSQFPSIIQVRARTVAGNPLAGVTITLTVVGNSGSFTPPVYNTAVTGVDGVASFPDYVLNKAGGYTVTARALEFGAGVLATSNTFNISGK
jgi:hypothetical protein